MNIWIAAADNNIEKVKEYLQSPNLTPNSRDQNGYTPIHAAVEYAHLDLLKYLIDHGGDINVKDSDGDTPLHACEQVSVAEKLVELGADINAKNDEDQTPLEKAEEDADFPELIDFLRKKSGIEQTLPETDMELPENMHVSLKSTTEEQIPEQHISDEQRERLAEIIQNGTDADFEEYVQNALAPQESALEPQENAKKAKKSD